MTYRYMSDARVSAYAPVTARLMRDLRDKSHAVKVHQFTGCMASQVTLAKQHGDTGTLPTTSPPTWFNLGYFYVYHPPALIGRAGVDQLVLFVAAQIENFGTTTPAPSQVSFRLKSGAVISDSPGIGGPWVPAGLGPFVAGFTAAGLSASGLTQWAIEASFDFTASGSGSTAEARFQWRAADYGYLRCT